MNHRNFTPEDPALPMTYPGFVFRVLCTEGHAPSALLSGTGLTADSFADPNFRRGFAPLRRLLLNAIEQSGDPHLGIRLAKKFQPTFFGLPAYAAMNAGRFRDGLEVLNRFFFLAFPAVEFRFPDEGAELNDGDVAVRLRPKFPFTGIEYFASLSALVACAGLFRAIIRMDDVVSRVETTTSESVSPAWRDRRGGPSRRAGELSLKAAPRRSADIMSSGGASKSEAILPDDREFLGPLEWALRSTFDQVPKISRVYDLPRDFSSICD